MKLTVERTIGSSAAESSQDPCVLGGCASPQTKQARSPPLPRINIRKRKVKAEDRESLNLTSVNSAFLTGLFADVAEVQHEDDPKDLPFSGLDLSPPSEIHPNKKSRVSMARSISRCAKSFKALGDLLSSPKCAADIVHIQQGAPTLSASDLEREVSATNYQPPTTVSVTSSSITKEDGSKSAVSNGVAPVFPQLPATISITSCGTLTRNLSDLQSSVAESTQNQSYGWFVEMDNEEQSYPTYERSDPYTKCSSSTDLAFLAPTAPNASNHDAEVEWAKAADTVDDVLGDFF